MNWRESKKVICLQYKQYSCGRFVSNILSYNKHFLPQYNLDNNVSIDVYSNINYKHQIIMQTIPDESNLKNWRDYELGCDKFYGVKMYDDTLYRKMFHQATGLLMKVHFNNLLDTIKPKAKEIIETNNFFVFIVSHHDVCTRLVKEIFPNATLIEFINDREINRLSRKIKSNLVGSNDNVVKFTNQSYKFDIGTLLDESRFFVEIFKLINYLGCEDMTLDTKVYEYYKKYKSIYEPYLNSELCKK